MPGQWSALLLVRGVMKAIDIARNNAPVRQAGYNQLRRLEEVNYWSYR